jgi:flavin reductase (DIM6/NTAB) family NADH-FMN oxidoreductase RutF
MEKKELTPQCLIPVRPITIIGANVDGKPNFFTAGAGGLVSFEPPMVCVIARHGRYTLKGITANNTFSVNIPSIDQAKEADYCGITTGEKTDKVKKVNFEVLYGKLGTAPMIGQCHINMECTVMHLLTSTSHAIIIGRVDGTYVSADLMIDDKPDWDKINPLLWYPGKSEYLTPGKVLGKSRVIGKVFDNNT